MSEMDHRQRIDRILADAAPAPDDLPGARAGVAVSGHDNQVVVGDHNIIINDTRRPGERIDDDQLQELRDRVDSLARIDALLAARDPADQRDPRKRIEAARRRHWRAFRDRFQLKHYAHLAHGRFDEALCWLENRKQTLLDAAGPARTRRPAGAARPIRSALRLLALALLVVAVPLLFSVERTRPPAIAVTVPITHDPAPTFQPAAQIAPGVHAHAGCSFLSPPRLADTPSAANPQSI